MEVHLHLSSRYNNDMNTEFLPSSFRSSKAVPLTRENVSPIQNNSDIKLPATRVWCEP